MDLDYIFWYNNLAKLIVTGLLPFVSLCVFNFKASPCLNVDITVNSRVRPDSKNQMKVISRVTRTN